LTVARNGKARTASGGRVTQSKHNAPRPPASLIPDSACQTKSESINTKRSERLFLPLLFDERTGQSLWLDRDFDDAVAPLAKQLVGIDDVVERIPVGDEWNQVQLAVSHQFDQPAHPLLAARA